MQLFLGAVPIILRLFSKARGHLAIILKLFSEFAKAYCAVVNNLA